MPTDRADTIREQDARARLNARFAQSQEDVDRERERNNFLSRGLIRS
jgi:hypothetical protein